MNPHPCLAVIQTLIPIRRQIALGASVLLLMSALPAFGEGGHAKDDAFWAEVMRMGVLPQNALTEPLPAPEPDQRHEMGHWGPAISWPHVPVSAANLPDGRVLTWSSSQDVAVIKGRDDEEFTFAAVWEPSTNEFRDANLRNHDAFCTHLAMLNDGRVFANGGKSRGPLTSAFDFKSDEWANIENMDFGRWYPTTVALPNGKVFTVGGTGYPEGGENTAERWTEGEGWERLNGIDWSDVSDAPGFESVWWPYLFVAPNGKLFHAGPTKKMHWVDPSDTGALSRAGATVPGSHYPKHAGVAMYDEGKLLIAGGAAKGDIKRGNINRGEINIDISTHLAGTTNFCYTVDFNQPTPVATPIAPMTHARRFSNAIMLPNGEVLIIGGNTSGLKFSDRGTVWTPEIWNPKTGEWREVADMTVPRNYHSVALLLTDGTVLSAGSGLARNPRTDHLNGQIYTPPSQFNPDGSLALRPVITEAPAEVRHGDVIEVRATPRLPRFTMIRMMATTHGFSTDIRFLEVPSRQVSVLDAVEDPRELVDYELTMHSNPNVMTPGYWMLFALDANDVHSAAKVILVSQSPSSGD